jgi:hypothetical protein
VRRSSNRWWTIFHPVVELVAPMSVDNQWEVRWSSEDPRYGGGGTPDQAADAPRRRARLRRRFSALRERDPCGLRRLDRSDPVGPRSGRRLKIPKKKMTRSSWRLQPSRFTQR